MPLYLLNLADPEQARGADPAFAFRSDSAEGLAAELEDALRGDGLFQRWRDSQDDPDAVPDSLGATDPQAKVRGKSQHLGVLLEADTRLSGEVLKHRMRLLAGSHWTLNDVR